MRLEKMDGAWTALVTPFDTAGQVDWAAYDRNLAFQIEQGITGILPCGTTGESPTLNWEEHNRVIDEAIKMAKGKCPVLAGVGSNSTEEALRGAEHAAESGAEGLLLVDCYYNGPSSLELRVRYHGAVAGALPELAVVPYVIPGRTGCELSVEDLAILAGDHPNVIAVKEATGDLERMAHTRAVCGPDFSVMSGDDNITHEMMTSKSISANGVISVISNVAPAGVSQMVKAALDGDTEVARSLNDALTPLFDLVTVTVENERTLPNGTKVMVKDKFRNPLAVKTLMNGLGMGAGPTRRPLGKMTPKGIKVVRDAARTVWQNNPEILQPIESHYSASIQQRLDDDAIWDALTCHCCP